MDSVQLAVVEFLLAHMRLKDIPPEVRNRLFPTLNADVVIGDLYQLIKDRLTADEADFFRALGVLPGESRCAPSAVDAPARADLFWLERSSDGLSGTLCFEGGARKKFQGQPWNLLVLLICAGPDPRSVAQLRSGLGLNGTLDVVRSLLQRTRESLKHLPSVTVIENVRGEGYRIASASYKGGLEAIVRLAQDLSAK